MKYAKVTVEVAIPSKDEGAAIVDDMIFYALSRGSYDDVGLGNIELVEERPIDIDEDGVPNWSSVRKGE